MKVKEKGIWTTEATAVFECQGLGLGLGFGAIEGQIERYLDN